MGTWGTAATPCSQLRDIQRSGRKGRREKTADIHPSSDPEPMNRGAQIRGGQKEHQEQSKDAPRQRDRERERERGCPVESKTEKKRPRGGAEEAYLRRNLWGTANFPKSSRK